jgi:hypothetical protein
MFQREPNGANLLDPCSAKYTPLIVDEDGFGRFRLDSCFNAHVPTAAANVRKAYTRPASRLRKSTGSASNCVVRLAQLTCTAVDSRRHPKRRMRKIPRCMWTLLNTDERHMAAAAAAAAATQRSLTATVT